MRSIRIGCLGDSHYEQASPRWAECQRTHEWIADLVRDEDLDAVTHGGDVHDGISTPDERLAFSHFAQRITSLCPLYIARGNHDKRRDLQIYAHLEGRHAVTVVEHAEVVSVTSRRHDGMLRMGMVGWPSMASTRDPEASRAALGDLLRGLGQEMAGPDPRLLIGHFDIRGATVGAGQPMRGGALTVGLEDLSLAGAHAVVASHIHKPQGWTFGGVPMGYAGSPYRTDFGETEEKSFSILEIFEDGAVRWERIPIPTRPMQLFEATWDQTLQRFTGAVRPVEPGADVRFRYTTTVDGREAARDAASLLRDAWKDQGASTVDLDEELEVTVRARVPEISTATTLPEKLHTMWNARGDLPSMERFERLTGPRLATAEEDVDPGGQHARTSGAVRLDSVSMGGLVPFPETVSVDFRSIPGMLVAVTGENGAGKSTFLEAITGGTLYRRTATRGTLVDLARSREAFVHSRIVNGAAWEIRHEVDAVSGSGRSFVCDAEGADVLEDRKVTTYDAWAKKHLPPPEVLYTSTVAPQASAKNAWASFLRLDPKDRKNVLLRVLGVERLEKLATAARKRAAAAKEAIARLDARIGELQGADVVEATVVLEARKVELDAALTEDSAATAELVALTAKVEAIRAQNVEIEQHRQTHAQALALTRAMRDRIEDLRGRLRAVRSKAYGSLKEARAAAEHLGALDEEIATLRETLARLQAESGAAANRHASAATACDSAMAAHRQAEAKVEQARRDAAEREKLRVEVAMLPIELDALARAERHLRSADEEIARLHALAASGAEGRIKGLREGLQTYVDGHEDQGFHAIGVLRVDDAAALALQLQPGELAAAQASKRSSESVIPSYRAEIARIERLQAKLDTPDGVAEAEAACAAAAVAVEESSKRVEAALADHRTLREAIARHGAEHVAALGRRKILAEQAARLPEIERAQTLVEEVSSQLAAAEKDYEGAVIACTSLPDPVSPLPLPDTTAATRRERLAGQALADARANLRVAEMALEQAQDRVDRRNAILAERQGLVSDLEDFTRLGEDLGRDGLQALEIDAIAPRLTALTNELLHTCAGSRWSVAIEMGRASEDAKKEACTVRVLDQVTGEDCDAEFKSGGESVIVGEAISLALTVLACQAWGAAEPTLVRDESGSALSPTMAKAYVAMLRRAATMTNASQVLLVSHMPEVVGMCDARIHVAAGTIEVQA